MATPIDYRQFIHPQDRAALDALEKVPFFDTVLAAFMKLYDEKVEHAINMASKLRLGPEIRPDIYNMLVDICGKLGIEVPELYLTQDPNPNAWTFGETKPYITVTSGLVAIASPREIYATLAHECGHIICHHVLYTQVAIKLIELGTSFFGVIAKFAQPLIWAFQYWRRKSELSADRVEVYCLEETDTFIRESMRFCGFGSGDHTAEEIAAFMKQAEDYESMLDDSFYQKALQAFYIKDMTHPFMTVRCREVVRWFEENKGNLPESADAPKKLQW